MAIGKISGAMLFDNLDRQGVDLQYSSFNSPLLYLNFSANTVGVGNSAPTETLTIGGNFRTQFIRLAGNTISTLTPSTNLILNPTGNVQFNTVATSSANIHSGTGSFGFVGNLYGFARTPSQPNITSLGTLTSLSVTGNVSTGNVSGTTVSGTTGSFTNLGGTLTTAAQPNITSVGTLTALAVTGNITSSSSITASSNISATNVNATQVTGTSAIFTTLYGNLFATSINGTVQTGNVSLYDSFTQSTANGTFYPQLADKLTGNGAVFTASTLSHNPSTGVLSATQFSGTGNFTTAVATNFSSSNVRVSGGYIQNLSNVTAATGFVTTLNSSAANISGPVFATSINTANAVIGGGYISSLTNATIATASITNLSVPGNVTITGNTTASSIYATSVTAPNFAGNLTGTLLTPSQPLITTVGNLTSLSVTGNVNGSNLLLTGNISVNSVTGSNFNGNLTGTVLTSVQPFITTVGTLGNLTVTNSLTTGSLLITGNLTVPYLYTQLLTTDNITSNTGNIVLTALGPGVVSINAYTALTLPAGTTLQRPPGTIGDIRVNTDTGVLEYYGGSGWIPLTYLVSDQSFSGDGANDTFTLTQETTAAGIIVSINGTMQQPTTAYTVVGNQITFSETPLITDSINIRYIASAVTADTNTSTVSTANVVVGTSNIVIDSFGAALYRSAKYIISSSNATDAHMAEILVIHKNGVVDFTAYGVVNTGVNYLTYSANISGSTVNLIANSTVGSNTLRIQKTYFNL